jgi:hypothetical protein
MTGSKPYDLGASLVLPVDSVKLRGFEEMLALAGFLVASVEFRNSLGVPKNLGTSAFEIMILALPPVILAIGFAAVGLRDGRRSSAGKSLSSWSM